MFLRVADSIRLQLIHTIDYRKALANAASADERKRGCDLSRALQRDTPVAARSRGEPARHGRAPTRPAATRAPVDATVATTPADEPPTTRRAPEQRRARAVAPHIFENAK